MLVHAGKVISGSHPDPTEELYDAFRIAHSWRNGHLPPMRKVRDELSGKVRRISDTGIAAGRLKRFQSMRRKLQRRNLSLYQMQDIAGVRAILANTAEVEQLASIYLSGGSRHEVIDAADDYIARPKRDGYRSKHIVLRFNGPDDITGGNRITVELQLRTRLQHAWATAVEAVGLVNNENLKGGEGNPDWLRFFELVSGEFAHEEQRPMVPGVPEGLEERRRELVEIAHRIDAIATLESYNETFRQTEGYLGLKGHSYVLQFDPETKTATVRSYSSFSRLSDQSLADDLNDRRNTIIIEIDKVGDLREAYPNYFMDVRMFTERLRSVMVTTKSGNTRMVKPPSKWAKYLDFLYQPRG